jgi:trans-2,3-dihydro-3-hydroxyanthranilate isomerase
MHLKFCTVDVFTKTVFSGAQIAVVFDAENLDDEQMQAIAAEFAVSDTVFVRAVAAEKNHFSLRIFTPHKETGFGSHTTVAAAYALAHTGQLSLKEKHTPLLLQHRGEQLTLHVSHREGEIELVQLSWVTQPIVDNYVPSTGELAELLSLSERDLAVKPFRSLLVSNNGIYIVVPVRGLEAIKSAQFNTKAWNQSLAAHTAAHQLLLFSQQCETPGSDFHLKLFNPNVGPQQNPPVGAAIPAFGAYLCVHQHIKPGTYSFIAERGLRSARQSLLHVELDNKGKEELTLRIGGNAVIVSEGRMKI